MADFHLTKPDDNPALTDPIYADAHKPRQYLFFSSVLDANGEIRLTKVQGELRQSFDTRPPLKREGQQHHE
jgi:hypothetical protein